MAIVALYEEDRHLNLPAGRTTIGYTNVFRQGDMFSPAKSSVQPDLNRYVALSEGQVVPEPIRCVQCGICSYNCPINIDVRAHAWRGWPVQDSHCLTCGQCVARCPRGVLRFERIELFAG